MADRASVIVRAPTEVDVERLAEVHVRAWQAAYVGLMPQDYLDGLDVAQRAQQWRRRLADPAPTEQVVVADRGTGGVVGFVVVGSYRTEEGEEHPGDHVGELMAINVLADHWGTGVGRQLMDAAVAGLAGVGFTEAVLWVIDGNVRARRFYEAAGWAPDGATKLDPRGGWEIREVRYRRALPPVGAASGKIDPWR